MQRRAGEMAARLVALTLVVGCAVNPATGAREFMLVSESQEIAMGREADPSIVGQMGLYPDTAMQAYVTRLGTDLAARAERPQLPWTFRVLDDPVINAFALPGGYVYITRGILAHFSSEAELVSVLGHEIGHVTARHSAAQMSQQQLAGIGVVAGSILAPELSPLLGAAQAGLGLLFLKFSRDDESEADRLGLRYMIRAQYDPHEMPKVFRMLGRVSSMSGAGRIPEWQSTHPNPENREATIEQSISQLEGQGQSFDGFTIERASYLRRIDGMVFGPNPREGYFKESVFYHPDLAFELTFPEGWQHANLRQTVVAQSPNQDAIIRLTLAEEATPSEAARVFLTQEGVQRESGWRDVINGLAVSSAVFRASTEQGTLAGLVAFVAHEGRVYRLLGYTPAQRWSTYSTTFAQSFETFARVTDRGVLDVQPARIRIVVLDRAMTLPEFERRYPSTVSSEVLAAINGLDADATIPAGTALKRVAGGVSP